METLDKCFENVCELDLIFHCDAVHQILAELVMGEFIKIFLFLNLNNYFNLRWDGPSNKHERDPGKN